jgi:hypothetical protein
MRTVMAVCIFLFSLTGFGEGTIPGLSAQLIMSLRDFEFEFAFAATPTKPASVSAEIRNEAENRFLQIVVPNLFPTVDKRSDFVACPSTLEHSDGFSVSGEYEGEKITAFVSEFKTSFFITPKNPTRLDKMTAQSAFHAWTSRLLKPMWLAEGPENRIEVCDQGDFLRVIRVFFEEDGTRRYLPWTKLESQEMAIDKDGRWLILSIIDVAPEVCKSTPQSGGAGWARYRGSWFTDPPRDKNVIIRKDGPVRRKLPKRSQGSQN